MCHNDQYHSRKDHSKSEHDRADNFREQIGVALHLCHRGRCVCIVLDTRVTVDRSCELTVTHLTIGFFIHIDDRDASCDIRLMGNIHIRSEFTESLRGHIHSLPADHRAAVHRLDNETFDLIGIFTGCRLEAQVISDLAALIRGNTLHQIDPLRRDRTDLIKIIGEVIRELLGDDLIERHDQPALIIFFILYEMPFHQDGIDRRHVIDQRMVLDLLQKFIRKPLIRDVHHEVRRLGLRIRIVDTSCYVFLHTEDGRQEHRHEDHQEHDAKERAFSSFHVGTK